MPIAYIVIGALAFPVTFLWGYGRGLRVGRMKWQRIATMWEVAAGAMVDTSTKINGFLSEALRKEHDEVLALRARLDQTAISRERN